MEALAFIFTFITASLLLTLRHFSLFRIRKFSQLPPGPLSLPILGNLLQIVRNPHKKLSSWAEKYGALYTLRFGVRSALIVNDPKILRKLFSQAASTGKFKSDTVLLLGDGQRGVLNSEGRSWQEQRHFFLRTLKEFGGSIFESGCLQEINRMNEWIINQNSCNGVVPLHKGVNTAVVNIFWTLVSSQPQNSSEMELLLAEALHATQATMKSGLGWYPLLKKIAPNLSGYLQLKKVMAQVKALVQKQFHENLSTFTEEDAPQNVIDAYIKHYKKMENNNESAFSGQEGFRNCISSNMEIMVAAADNSVNVILWTCIYIACKPKIKEKLQQEIDSNFKDREPTFADRKRMPYIEAVILESLRFSSEAPFGAFHEFCEDFSFEGYHFPKGLILVGNLYHIHHDHKIWGDPENFRPERFLDGGKEQLENLRNCVVAFQPGKRTCPGEGMARNLIFLVIVKINQLFNLESDPRISMHDYLEPNVGIVLSPKPLGLVMRPRESA